MGNKNLKKGFLYFVKSLHHSDFASKDKIYYCFFFLYFTPTRFRIDLMYWHCTSFHRTSKCVLCFVFPLADGVQIIESFLFLTCYELRKQKFSINCIWNGFLRLSLMMVI